MKLLFESPSVVPVLILALGCTTSPGAQGPQATEPLQEQNLFSSTQEPVVFRIANGRIEIKPRLKYELAISIHVLRYAEDHHQLFTPWAEEMRDNLSENTLRQASTLIEMTHEWQLGSLVQNYDGPDTIDGLVSFVADEGRDHITRWAHNNSRNLMKRLKVEPGEFPAWYADFLQRYYSEGFAENWTSEQKTLVYQDAERMAEELASPGFSVTDFMERHTGRLFSDSGGAKIILYPSSFSRPQHAYGFTENGHKVIVYKAQGRKDEVIGSIFHELLHPLIREWWEAERMEHPIADLAKESSFRESWKRRGKGNYSYPERWLDEVFVHAVANYLKFEAGLVSESQVRRGSYCDYEDAVYDAIFDRYDEFASVDDFIYFALTHINATGDGSNTAFRYGSPSKNP